MQTEEIFVNKDAMQILKVGSRSFAGVGRNLGRVVREGGARRAKMTNSWSISLFANPLSTTDLTCRLTGRRRGRR